MNFSTNSRRSKIDIFYRNALKKGNLTASTDISYYSKASVVIVDINLVIQKTQKSDFSIDTFEVNLEPFKNGIRTIGENCNEDVLILVETTVPPGTCNNIVKPILFDAFAKRGMSTSRLKIAHSYEARNARS